MCLEVELYSDFSSATYLVVYENSLTFSGLQFVYKIGVHLFE